MRTNCSLPLYLQSDITSVESCSTRSGYWGCFKLSIVVLIFFLFFRFWAGNIIYGFSDSETDEEKKKRENYNNWLYGIFGSILLLIWIFYPKILVKSDISKWNGYQTEKSIYMKNGLSEQDALNKVAENFNAKQLADSMSYMSSMSHHHHH